MSATWQTIKKAYIRTIDAQTAQEDEFCAMLTNSDMFEIQHTINGQRIGRLHTRKGAIRTPFFMPIATRGAVKSITTEEIKQIGYEVILGNTYHLWLRPGDELIARAGDLHAFSHWDKGILTDSGGYQVFSLGKRAETRYGKSGVKLSEEGVEFIDPVNGKKYFMSPEKSIDIQLNLGSDIIMCLDECPPYPCDHEYAKKSLELTTRWAERCFSHFHKRVQEKDYQEKYPKGRPLLFCIVQGSTYEDLRKESARQLTSIDFEALGGPQTGWDGYAIGGVAVGEPREKMYEILTWVLPLLPEDRPRYLMGLGKPEEIVAAVRAGVDMFDCVIPTREGRHGRLFVFDKDIESLDLSDYVTEGKISNAFYHELNLNNEQYKEAFSSVDPHCPCHLCQNYTRAYERHLFAVSETLAMRLASLHNLTFYYQLLQKLGETQ